MDYKPYFKCTPHRQPTADSEKAYGRLHLKWVTAVECFFALQRCLPPHFRKRSSPCLEQFQQENPLNACLCHFLLKINMCVCACVFVFSSPPAVRKQAVGVCSGSQGWRMSSRTVLPCASPPPVSAHSSSESSTGSPHKTPEYLAKASRDRETRCYFSLQFSHSTINKKYKYAQ